MRPSLSWRRSSRLLASSHAQSCSTTQRTEPSPELNPVERVWEYLRDRWLSHRVLAGGYEAVVDAACAAWNALLAEPGRLRSLTNFPWLPASVTIS